MFKRVAINCTLHIAINSLVIFFKVLEKLNLTASCRKVSFILHHPDKVGQGEGLDCGRPACVREGGGEVEREKCDPNAGLSENNNFTTVAWLINKKCALWSGFICSKNSFLTWKSDTGGDHQQTEKQENNEQRDEQAIQGDQGWNSDFGLDKERIKDSWQGKKIPGKDLKEARKRLLLQNSTKKCVNLWENAQYKSA